MKHHVIMDKVRNKREEIDGQPQDFEMFVEQLLDILSRYPQGARDDLVKKEYEEKYGILPENWLRTLKDVPEIDAVSMCNKFFLCAKKEQLETKRRTSEPGPKGNVRLAMDLMKEHNFEVSEAVPETNGAATSEPAAWSLDELNGLSPMELLSFLKKPELREQELVYVTVLDSPLNISVRLVRFQETYQELLKEMHEFYGDMAAGTHISGGGAVSGLYAAKAEGSWHRVQAATPLRSPVPSVTVQFCDHGDIDNVDITDLRLLDPQFIRFPRLSLQLSLDGFQSDPVQPCLPDVVNMFSDLIFKDPPIPMLAKFHSCNLSEDFEKNIRGQYVVTLLASESTTNPSYHVNINEAVISYEQQVLISEGMKPNERRLRSVPSASAPALTKPDPGSKARVSSTKDLVFRRSFAQDVGAVKDVPKPSSDSKAGASSSDQILVRESLVPMDVPRKRHFRAMVVSAPDPSEFTIQLQSLMPMPDYIAELLNTEMKESLPLPPTELLQGSYYAGWDEEDDLWRRVCLCSYSTVTGLCRVFLVDTAEFRMVPASDIRLLPKATFVAKNMLAIKCQLVGVGPKDPRDRTWAPEVGNAFSKKVLSKTWEVENVGEERVWQTADAPALPLISVRLRDAATQEDVSDWLIQQGLASPTPQ